jgi:hypothetical protein
MNPFAATSSLEIETTLNSRILRGSQLLRRSPTLHVPVFIMSDLPPPPSPSGLPSSPPPSGLPPPAVSSTDAEHLRLLSIFHYIVGGLGAFFACFPLVHVAMGIFMVVKPEAMGGNEAGAPPAFFGYLMAGFGLLLVVMGWAMAICTIISGRFLAQRRRRTFSIVVAAIQCLFIPLGTILGIFTIIVLGRESVQRLYRANG